MSKPTCRELLDQIYDEVVLPQQALASRIERILKLRCRHSAPSHEHDDQDCSECKLINKIKRLLDGENSGYD